MSALFFRIIYKHNFSSYYAYELQIYNPNDVQHMSCLRIHPRKKNVDKPTNTESSRVWSTNDKLVTVASLISTDTFVYAICGKRKPERIYLDNLFGQHFDKVISWQ